MDSFSVALLSDTKTVLMEGAVQKSLSIAPCSALHG